ncbi:MAG: histidinol-phosphate transaminase [Pseudomonadales bacterium]
MTQNNINASIATLNAYQPGKPIDELARELGIADILKLASNENPRGPGEQVRAALTAVHKDLSLYPDGSGYRLKAVLAERHGVSPAQITLGNGSNDVLDLAARVALEPGCEAIVSEHAFVVYRLATIAAGATLVTVPAVNFGMDLGGVLRAVTERTRIVFIANPNNPTGTWLSREAITGFLDTLPSRVWVVLDEAYTEYVGRPDFPNGLTLLDRYPNLIVTRTFSKIHGLAALRLGFAVSNPQFADLMNRLRQPFNVNSMALAAGEAALADDAFVRESRELNDAGMRQLEEGFDRLNLPRIPSLGNFIAVDVGEDARAVYDALLREGVIVRPIAEYGLPRHLRVTIGLPDQNRRLLDSLARVLEARRRA